jgi:hypothetical protein
MSATARDRPADAVAGFLASASIFVSLIALVHRPVRLLPATLLVAFVAAGLGGRHRRLAAVAVAVAAICWVAGLTIAVATNRPLY